MTKAMTYKVVGQSNSPMYFPEDMKITSTSAAPDVVVNNTIEVLLAKEMKEYFPTIVNVAPPAVETPIVNVAAPIVNIEPTKVEFTFPKLEIEPLQLEIQTPVFNAKIGNKWVLSAITLGIYTLIALYAFDLYLRMGKSL